MAVDLFGEVPDTGARLGADGWIGWPGLMGKARAGAWTHPALPGVVVRHCGHPTALRPYYVTGLEEIRGATFHNLARAKAAAAGQPEPPI